MASRTRRILPGVLIGALFMLGAARGAGAQQALDFTLDNETGLDIVSVLIRPSHTHSRVPHDWSNDALGIDMLGDRAQTRIHFPTSAEWLEGRRWDLLAYDRAGDIHVWKDIDFAATSRVTLFYDGDTGRTWALTQ